MLDPVKPVVASENTPDDGFIYETLVDNETPSEIAELFDVPVEVLVRSNVKRFVAHCVERSEYVPCPYYHVSSESKFLENDLFDQGNHII